MSKHRKNKTDKKDIDDKKIKQNKGGHRFDEVTVEPIQDRNY